MKTLHTTDKPKDNYEKIKKIDSAVILLMNLSSMARFKNIQPHSSFSDEFFKGVKEYFK